MKVRWAVPTAYWAVADEAGVLEELIVTAEKRETTIQDTPIAVSAFSQEDLERGLDRIQKFVEPLVG